MSESEFVDSSVSYTQPVANELAMKRRNPFDVLADTVVDSYFCLQTEHDVPIESNKVVDRCPGALPGTPVPLYV